MRTLIVLILLCLSANVRAELVVVVHPKNPVSAMSPQQVQAIFMGRMHTFPNGEFVAPLDQSSSARAQFYQKLTNRPIQQIDAYWARIMFTGRAYPPKQLLDDEAVLNTVHENEYAIGYVDKSRVDSSVRAILVLP